MFRKNLIYIVLLICFQQQFVSGQVITYLDHLKYWHYRQRLISDFLVIGIENDIANQPFNYFNDNTTIGNYGGYGLSIPCAARYDQNKQFHNHCNWGDGTTYLGWYIGVLSTELRLLYNNQQNYSNTQYELFCALKAYERLDANCEAIAYPHTNNYLGSKVNGLFIRDDVDYNLFANNLAFGSKLNTWDSDLKKAQNDGNNGFPSPDQCAHLFMGFALVEKCLSDDNGVAINALNNYTYNGTTYNLIQLVQNYALAIGMFFEGNMEMGVLPNGKPYKNCDVLKYGAGYGFAYAAWHLTNSLCGNLMLSAYCDQCTYAVVNNCGIECFWKDYPFNLLA
jgi:hypothetical protein